MTEVEIDLVPVRARRVRRIAGDFRERRGAMFTAARTDWRTPSKIRRGIATEFGELFDTSDRHDGAFDALRDPWPEPWWCNPPYNGVGGGRPLREWVKRMRGRGVALLPARTDAIWFHDEVLARASEVRFLRGRLKYDDGKGKAPFPSMIVVFGDWER